MNTIDQRGIGKQLKRVLPTGLFRAATVAFNSTLSLLPASVTYGVGGLLRRTKYPYRVIEDGDVVLQVGAPRDTLKAGRSRAMHFARMVGRGVVVVMEPDPENCAALKEHIERNRLQDRVRLFEVGGWNAQTSLAFFSSPTHPAANVVADAKDIPPELAEQRGYRKIVIPVDTVDNVLAVAGVAQPKLVSITTNGAEKQILEGMQRTLGRGVPYISLASTQRDLVEHTQQLKFPYDYIARDDRGYCFRRRTT